MSFTVKLMKNPDNIGITAVTRASSLATQSAYFDRQTSKTYSTPTFIVGEPIRVVANDIQDVMQYPYGYILDGTFRWYFVVTSVTMVSRNLIQIDYQIDCYETAQYQMNLTFKRATIRRCSKIPAVGQTDMMVIEPYQSRLDVQYSEVGNPELALFFVYRKTDIMYNAVIYPKAGISDREKQYFAFKVTTGQWLSLYCQNLGISDSDLWFVGLSYAELDESDFTSSAWAKQAGSGDYYDLFVSAGNSFSALTHNFVTPVSIQNHIVSWREIDDMRGNCVFKAPPYLKVVIKSVSVDFSASSACLRYRIGFTGQSGDKMITVPVEPVDIFVDAYKEYLYRQRDSDFRMRELELRQTAVQGLANLGQSAVGGAIAGSAVPGIGTVAGAVAGTVVSGAGILGSYLISGHYAREAQVITDDAYRKALDTLNQFGTIGIASTAEWVPHYIQEVEMDAGSKALYEDDVTTNGYYVNAFYDNLGSSTALWPGPLTMDCEPVGDFPAIWGNAIADRFSNGVRVVNAVSS